MIEEVIEYSIRNRFLVIFLAAGLTAWAVYAALDTPVDALPDLSEHQVIVFTDWMGRSPREVEDQVTYPLSLKLQGLAGVKAVRSTSEFNYSMITLIFEDRVPFYFARERVLEKLSLAGTFLPAGAVPFLAPDETALGQIFWYTLEGGDLDPGRMWALQKYYVAPELNSVPGVAEVGTAGGLPKEYQIDVDPEALRAHGVTLGDLYEAVARSNAAVGGRTIQKNRADYLVRAVGWITSPRDIEDTVVKQVAGTPVYVKNLATVQVGVGYRRNVLEKDGNEVVGGVVLMRYGENPLAVTERIKQKIQELQPGLPAGVHIVPAYDRTGLIRGAIHSLTEVMWHEMVIAALAILLILVHVRSVLVICVTLLLSVLFSFLQMWLLRKLGVIDVQANIMSLAGITISIGILVDQAIVMVENATHHLREKFGKEKVRGDTREIVIRACRTVGRPIFFSVVIILLSFVPVFAMSGREGKLFTPMAFTKSLAMVGVAVLSVTLVPALLPTFLKGRLRSEEDNWIVRSFIHIYKPLLTWALPRRNLVMWAFAALLILAVGLFPLQALLGLGAAHHAWQIAFFCVLAFVVFLTVTLTRGLLWQAVSFVSLVLLGLAAYHFPKIGVEFMPALNEGTLLEMPVSVPRLGLSQAADDLKARDALLRGFPEVESVIGKAGRADTPTDPAPLEMIETFINYRPRELWPKRALKFEDASWQAARVVAALEQRGYLRPQEAGARDDLVNAVAMKALARFDEVMRDLALRRYREFERSLEPILVRFTLEEALRRFEAAGIVRWPEGADARAVLDPLVKDLTPGFGRWLSKAPALEDVTRFCQEIARQLAGLRALQERDPANGRWRELEPADALALRESFLGGALGGVAETLGARPRTFEGEVLQAVEARRLALWREYLHDKVNGELFARGVEAFTWAALEEAGKEARAHHLLHGEARGQLVELRKELEGPFAAGLLLWRRDGSPRGDLVKELDTVVQVPGWSNIWTQPIANRIDMLATGVRTPVGVRVFGPDLDTINRACQQVAEAVRPVRGAQNVVATPIMGKGYLEIAIDRHKAARYGVSVGDIQDTIEVALGGKVITQTVEGRDRFPVRLRYARDFRQDEEQVKRLLVSGTLPAAAAGTTGGEVHAAAPSHTPEGKLQIPLSEVADVHIVEGPAMIPSENGRLRNYVTMTVSGERDLVGFVEEARRVVAEKVQLPPGVHIEWAGQFEDQVRAARTLRVLWPAVFLLIFVILYLTYQDLGDAGLMMLAVPEALAGGIFFQFLFPKLRAWDWGAAPEPFTVAVWVGYIAAFGMAAETGIIMLVYLREAIAKRGGLENIKSLEELRQAVLEGAVHRLRPKLLTEGVAIVALAPMLFATGVGSEVISAMALPVLGGLLIADEVVDVFLPVRFYWVRRARWLKLQEGRQAIASGEKVGDSTPRGLTSDKEVFSTPAGLPGR
jgi:Cu(I)/Ag(I) efflux system membrane protein CusA/SilA